MHFALHNPEYQLILLTVYCICTFNDFQKMCYLSTAAPSNRQNSVKNQESEHFKKNIA